MKDIIIELRLLIAWILIGWAFNVMPDETPDKANMAEYLIKTLRQNGICRNKKTTK